MADSPSRDDRHVFLLGAGFARAVSAQMPLLLDLLDPIRHKLQPKRPEYDATPFIDTNVELALTYLFQAHPWLQTPDHLRNRALGIELSSALAEVVRERQQAAQKSLKDEASWLYRFAHWIHHHRATVITFNYDTLLEDALSSVYVNEMSCISGWDCIPITFASDGYAVLRSEPKPSATVLKLHGSLGWYYSGRSSYYGEQLSHNSRGRVPLIVPPASDKAGYFENEDMRHLWQLASQSLAAATCVYCVGYSLPETDLSVRYLLKTSLSHSKPKLWVVDKAEGTAERYAAVLGNVNLDKTYVGPNCVERLVDDLIAPDLYRQAPDSGAGMGPVQTAIRNVIAPGYECKFGTLLGASSYDGNIDNGSHSSTFSEAFSRNTRQLGCKVHGLRAEGLHVFIGEGRMPVLVTWEELETIVPVVISAGGVASVEPWQRGQFGLRQAFDDWCAFTELLLPLLFECKVLEPIYVVNTWRLRLGQAISKSVRDELAARLSDLQATGQQWLPAERMKRLT